MLPTKFQFIWPSRFREDLKKLANQKQKLFVNGSEQNEQPL
jgi:mRNA-degrading endonuclease RelE of RelBE toxin-antitoxin system